MSQEKIDINDMPGVRAFAEAESKWMNSRPFDPRGLIDGRFCPECHTYRVERRGISPKKGLVYVLCSECGWDAWINDPDK